MLMLISAVLDSSVCIQGQQEGLGASFLKSLHTHFRFPGKPEKAASANLDDTGTGASQDEA